MYQEENYKAVNEANLEAAHETFEQALEDKNWSLALDIIGDVKGWGFKGEAEQMMTSLQVARR